MFRLFILIIVSLTTLLGCAPTHSYSVNGTPIAIRPNMDIAAIAPVGVEGTVTNDSVNYEFSLTPVPTPTPYTVPNLIINPGFETALGDEWVVVVSSGCSGSAVRVAPSGFSFEGTDALKIDVSGTTGTCAITATQRTVVGSVEPGDIISVGAWVYVAVDGGLRRANLQGGYRAIGGEWLGAFGSYDAMPPVGGWNYLAIENVVAPADTSYAQVTVELRSSGAGQTGTAHFDRVFAIKKGQPTCC